MLKNETKHKIKNGVIVFLAGLVILAVTAAAFAFSNVDSFALDTINYQIAGVNEEGAVESSDKSSLVSSLVEVDGLEITVEDNAKASYVVHYYDEDKEYISSSDVLDVDYALEAPENAKYARIEIVPNDDNYITIFEKAEYASQINVNVAK
jgi:hypothetical protein